MSKSTHATLVFGHLKQLGYNVEYVSEVAKNKTWRRDKTSLSVQPYITGKQLLSQVQLLGQVEIIVTDSPLLTGLVHLGEWGDSHFVEHVKHTFRKFNNLNIFLTRNTKAHPYNPMGRKEDEATAVLKDQEIRSILDDMMLEYYCVKPSKKRKSVRKILKLIGNALEGETESSSETLSSCGGITAAETVSWSPFDCAEVPDDCGLKDVPGANIGAFNTFGDRTSLCVNRTASDFWKWYAKDVDNDLRWLLKNVFPYSKEEDLRSPFFARYMQEEWIKGSLSEDVLAYMDACIIAS